MFLLLKSLYTFVEWKGAVWTFRVPQNNMRVNKWQNILFFWVKIFYKCNHVKLKRELLFLDSFIMCFSFGNTMLTWSSVISNGLGMIFKSMHKFYSSAAVRWHCQTVWHMWNCSLNVHRSRWKLACQVDVYCGVCSLSSVPGTFETEAHIKGPFWCHCVRVGWVVCILKRVVIIVRSP